MRIVFTKNEVERGLTAIHEQLIQTLGPGRLNRWNFPGGPMIDVETWQQSTRPPGLTIGSGPYRGEAMLILLANEPIRPRMSSAAEVNVPFGGAAPSRSRNGCLCLESESKYLLCHRGLKFTVKAHQVIPKKRIHQFFSDWLQDVEDGGRTSAIIVIGPIGPGLVDRLALFAQRVQSLKSSWPA